MRLADLASTLGLSFEGDPGVEITGLAGLDDAQGGELSFVTGPRYRGAFQRSRGGAFLLPPEFDAAGRPCLRSATPYADFARAVAILYPRAEPEAGVHPTAVVAEDVKLGADVSVAACAVIGAGSRIGDRTRIHPHVTIYPNVVVGADCEIHSGAHLREGVRLRDRVVIQNGAVLGSDGFGFVLTAEGTRVRVPHRCGVELCVDVEVGANTAIDASHPAHARGGRESSATWIGPRVKIDNLVQVAHGVSVGEGTVLCAQVGLSGSTEIGKNVFFGGRSATAGHLRVGDGSLVGAMSALAGDAAPGSQVLGVPGIERRLWTRVVAAWKRLPELLRRVRRIEEQLGLRNSG